MSYYSTWYLEEPALIHDPRGFLDFIDKLREDNHIALASLIRWDVDSMVRSEDVTTKIIEKVYTFYGFYPKDGEYENGTYGINHFSPGEAQNIQFISDLSKFTGELSFIVFGEGWPAIGPAGDAYLVTALDGVAAAIPHELVEVK